MNNLDIYNQLKEVPKEAKKTIGAGRLKGMTDIKPMWRIEKLTEIFGMCGIGWKTVIKNKEIIEGANNEKIAIVDIDLYVKVDGAWSEAIEGTGGSSFVANERNGLYTSDECYKMAYTDALSVACKSLGMGADVYWGDSKYNKSEELTKEYAEKYVLTFGKYKDRLLKDVIKEDEGYREWLMTKGQEDVRQILCLITGEEFKTDAQLKERLKLIIEMDNLCIKTKTDKIEMYDYYGVENNTEMTDEQLKDAINILKKKENK